MMPPPWVASAAALPVAFAQVREDPRVDLATLDLLDAPRLAGLMIASGGCTAAVLAAAGRFERLHLVDVNPAQLALARLKLHLLDAPPDHRLAVCGHARMTERAEALAKLFDRLELPPDSLGPFPTVASLSPDHAGRYELLFAQLQRAMRYRWADVLSAGTTDPDPANTDAAFDRIFSLPNLVALFGDGATQNPVEPFARHFAAGRGSP